MATTQTKAKVRPTARQAAKSLFVWTAATEFAVALIVVLIVVLSWTTVLEGSRGPEFVHWYVYGSPWFAALFVLLAINILAAVLIRFPWKWHQAGFVVTHAGLLAVLGGMALSWTGAIDGRILLEEGAATDRIELPQRSEIRLLALRGDAPRWTAFSFAAGPSDWPAGRTLDLGSKNGVALRVRSFRRRGGGQPRFPSIGSGDPNVDEFEAGILLELTAGGDVQRLWLGRNGQDHTIDTPMGPMLVRFGHEQLRLGFSLRLLEFQRVWNPGGVGYASFVSRVHVFDTASAVDRTAEISVNEPLTYKGYTFYQLDFHTLPDGSSVSVFSVARNPGRPLIYLGVTIVCLGTLLTIFLRGPYRGQPSKAANRDS